MRVAIVSSLILAFALSGCVVPTGPVEVTRFNRIADGQAYGKGSFAVIAVEDGKASDALAASPYLTAVTREMQKAGYSEQTAAGDVTAQVTVNRSERAPGAARSPVSVGVGGSTGGYNSGVGIGVGLDITNLINKPKARIITQLSVRIVNRVDKTIIWEGRAEQEASAGSPAAQAGIAAAKLAEALFKDFPGVSGETIRVP